MKFRISEIPFLQDLPEFPEVLILIPGQRLDTLLCLGQKLCVRKNIGDTEHRRPGLPKSEEIPGASLF